MAGELAAWKLGFIAERTLCLSPRAAGFVDTKVAPFADTIGPAQLERLIEEAKARFDPEQTEAERLAAAEAGHFDIALADVGVTGRVRVDGDARPGRRAGPGGRGRRGRTPQLLLGSTESLDVRRSIAARQPGPWPATSTPSRPRDPAPHVGSVRWSCTSTSSTPPSWAPVALARVHETRGPITADRSATWCGIPDAQITVQPVLDLADHIQVGPTEPPPTQAPDPAARRHLRVRVLLPPRRRLRLRTPRPGPTPLTLTVTDAPDRPAPATRRPVADENHAAKTTGGCLM